MYWLPVLVMLAGSLVPTRVVVGNDGILVSWIGRRFFPYAAIEAVLPIGNDLELVLRGGRTARLPVGPKARARVDRRERVLRAIEARREHGGASQSPPDLRAVVARRGRDLRAWVDDLVTASGAAPYREPVVEREGLRRVLEDASAPPDARVGAAVALRVTCGPECPDEIRRVAGGVASSRVRIALERVADAPDADAAALAEAIRGVDSGEAKAGGHA